MQRRVITYQLVKAAAEELTDSGKKPTVERLRKLIVKNVTDEELAAHLENWLNGQNTINLHSQSKTKLPLGNRAVESNTQGIIIADNKEELPIVYVNPAFERITGYKIDEAIGKNFSFLQDADQDQPEMDGIRLALKEEREEQAVLRSYRKNGALFWNELYIAPVPDPDGKVAHFLGIINDITERKAMEEQLVHQATYDTLTDLPNRVLLKDRLRQAILYAKRSESIVSLLFLDLDRFKLINDSLGHQVGDHLLCAVAKRLKNCLRDTDTVSRIGGDEFIIIVSPLKSVEETGVIAQKILTEIRRPFHFDRHELIITTSLGISSFPRDGREADTLIRNADTAMYHAKDNGRGNFQFFTNQMNQIVSKRLSLQNYLHHALEREEFELHYQPIRNLQTGRVVAVEALLRWNNPVLKNITPMEFIPVAEETGLIVPVGEWVLKTAALQQVQWEKMGLTGLQMSVNASARQIKYGDLMGGVKKALKASQMDPSQLVIELTESTLMDHAEEMVKRLNHLKKLGIKLAIDDFGTGYSSLNYLKRFPVDKLKIDKVFVRDITHDPDDAAITLAIIAMSKSLKICVVAEGAQTQEEVDFLKSYQCDEVQGNYFSKPLDAESCTRYLKKNLLK